MTEVHTQAPIQPGTTPGLAATIALGRLLRLHPTAAVESIRFTVDGGTNPYSDDGPYVHAHATLVPGAHLVASEAFVVPDGEPGDVPAEIRELAERMIADEIANDPDACIEIHRGRAE